MQGGTHDLTRLNSSQQGQMDCLWVHGGLTSLIQGKTNLFLLSLYFPKVLTCSLGHMPATFACTHASVTGSPIRAADESEFYRHIVVIMTNLLLVYASDEWVSFNYL